MQRVEPTCSGSNLNEAGQTFQIVTQGRLTGPLKVLIKATFYVFFEIFGDKSSVDSNLNFDSGITYLLNKTQQLDLSIGKGLNNNLFFVSLGFSVNFN